MKTLRITSRKNFRPKMVIREDALAVRVCFTVADANKTRDAARRAPLHDLQSYLSAPLGTHAARLSQLGKFRETVSLTLLTNYGRLSWGAFFKSSPCALIQTLRVCALWCKHRRRPFQERPSSNRWIKFPQRG